MELVSGGSGGDGAAEADNRPIIPPRETHPFGALETRPLWDRPEDRAAPPIGSSAMSIAGKGGSPTIRRRLTEADPREQIDPSGTLAAVKEQQRQEDVEAIRLKTDREANRVKRWSARMRCWRKSAGLGDDGAARERGGRGGGRSDGAGSDGRTTALRSIPQSSVAMIS